LRAIETLALEAIDPGLRDWEADTLRLHRDFWKRRLERERAIARILLHGAASLFQPGLFDRRADREHGDGDELRQELDRRIRAIEATATAAIRPARAQLVMISRHRS
jgi:hypothetical protein